MNMRLRCLIVFLFFLVWILVPAHVLAGPDELAQVQEETATEEPATEEPATEAPEETTAKPAVLDPADVIEAVNAMRIENGLNPLYVHQVLMDIAAQTANALAATDGAAGHYRPCGMSLGQLLLMKGFALWGDLSQDGYRSENWVTAATVEQAISYWSSDDIHLDTMIDPNRSHIGVAVAVGEQVYVVLETALQTPSGKMQWGADIHLTQAAVTQAACMGLATQYAEHGGLSQYSIPVVVSTARPDGDVIHEVQYGQTLWSLAITYGTTIEQIKRLNNLSSDTVVPGWTLLIQKGAIQPVPSATPLSSFEPIKQDLITPTPRLTSTPVATQTPLPTEVGKFIRQNSLVVVAFVISISVLIAAVVGFGKKKE